MIGGKDLIYVSVPNSPEAGGIWLWCPQMLGYEMPYSSHWFAWAWEVVEGRG